ncbi:sulfurtransferase [Hoeflea sp. WL0058]|uniref:Sulfurtransferase n=1 Tax=Flavimaribacter sediminis TaxID=2865987 RepID=A0AAE2ZSQ6_9HYPH|nr:sulfurtransferase [Flavimaribacter sediminis]MBW8639985.1 sulfurtransferase [Flavimaribacter sediminis]
MRKYLIGATMAIAMSTAALAGENAYPNDHLIINASSLVELVAADSESPVVVIDMRPAEAFAEGHIAGAQSMPFTALSDPEGPVEGMLRSEAELTGMFAAAGLDTSSQIVLYDDRGGFRAARLFWLLELYGYRNVSILDGGIGAWTAADLPLSVGAGSTPAGRPRFPVAYTPRRYASAEWILERRDDAETVVVDVRPTDLFTKGHIPWARNIPWAANLDADGTMLDPQALAVHFLEAGVHPEDNVVVHCQNGSAAAHSYFALRLLGYPRVRVYDRSWSEWGADPTLPHAAMVGE